jgi:hypothetical protein
VSLRERGVGWERVAGVEGLGDVEGDVFVAVGGTLESTSVSSRFGFMLLETGGWWKRGGEVEFVWAGV